MADPIDVLIGKVETEFVIVNGGEVAWKIGNLEHAEHDAPPRIAWDEDGGTFSVRKESGPGDDEEDAEREPFGSVKTERAQLTVECWGETRELARQLMHRVILASTRANVSLDWTGYTKGDERHAGNGVIFVLRGNAEIQVPADTEHTVQVLPVLSFEHHTTAKGVTVDAEYPDP